MSKVDNTNDIIGRPGGLARAQKLSPERRKEIAAKAASTRWSKPRVAKKKKAKKHG
jgi:hypothetical protein